MNLDYFYGTQADQFSFIRIPKALVTEGDYASLSIQAKILYGLLLDRMSMASKNKWIDDNGLVYIIYQISEIRDDMHISMRKAVDYMGELENIGLVQKKQRGNGKPNLIYVKNFIYQDENALEKMQ